ncbi:MAG: hypothetical protein ACKPKO_31070, partial [Candidatus Fonsibacter sp.]
FKNATLHGFRLGDQAICPPHGLILGHTCTHQISYTENEVIPESSKPSLHASMSNVVAISAIQ